MKASTALVAALALALVVGAHAATRHHHRSHHHSRRHGDDEESDRIDIPPPPPMFGAGDGSVPTPDDVFRFMQEGATPATGASTSAPQTFVADLWNKFTVMRDTLAKQQKDNELKKLKAREASTMITEQDKQLQEVQEMVTRLQYCLESTQVGSNKSTTAAPSAQSGAAKSSATNAAASAVTDAKLNTLKLQLTKQQKEQEAKQKELDKREELLNQREELLRKRLEEVKQAEAKLKLMQNDVNIARAEPGKVKPGVTPPKTPVSNLKGKIAPKPAVTPKPATKPGAPKTPRGPRVLSPFARMRPEQRPCRALRSCGDCAANPRCGWCATTNSCQKVVHGQPEKCSAEAFSHLFCKSESCENHKDARSCLADPACGRCMDNGGSCRAGGKLGPNATDCSNWIYSPRFRALSLNVYGGDMSRNMSLRASIIFNLIRDSEADFVMLQEVEDWFLAALAQQPFAKSYHASDFGSGHAPGGLLLLSKLPLSSVSFYEKTMPGQVEVDQRGRVLVGVPRIGAADGNFAVAVTTLDWRSAENRAASLDFVFAVLKQHKNVILGGDFNFDFGAPVETKHLSRNFLDVWSVLRPKQAGFTWDPVQNEYARQSDPSSRPSRIDRMLVTKGWTKLVNVEKVGNSTASPHYGLMTDLKMFGMF